MKKTLVIVLALAALLVIHAPAKYVSAQELLPYDEQVESDYHPSPRYRESESHPFRIVGYILHPIGWALREGIFRPLSYFASSTPNRRDIMGFREPFDYRRPECFSSDDSTPNCHEVMPFNYKQRTMPKLGETINTDRSVTKRVYTDKEVFFPNINFDFDKRTLNSYGKNQTKQLSELLADTENSIKIVLQGNTDIKGSDKYNERLGMDRALAVKSELKKLGISQERITAVSFGETNPLSTEDTEQARALNRRVETKVQE